MMEHVEKVKQMDEKILKIKELLEALDRDASEFPAIRRNSRRALASLKMLELNISDLIAFDLVE